MSYFFLWTYWRSADPTLDAIRGRHWEKPDSDLLGPFGALRRKLKAAVGEQALADAGDDWFLQLQHLMFANMPVIPTSRLRGKTARRAP